jgi:hypothetical protein
LKACYKDTYDHRCLIFYRSSSNGEQFTTIFNLIGIASVLHHNRYFTKASRHCHYKVFRGLTFSGTAAQKGYSQPSPLMRRYFKVIAVEFGALFSIKALLISWHLLDISTSQKEIFRSLVVMKNPFEFIMNIDFSIVLFRDWLSIQTLNFLIEPFVQVFHTLRVVSHYVRTESVPNPWKCGARKLGPNSNIAYALIHIQAIQVPSFGKRHFTIIPWLSVNNLLRNGDSGMTEPNWMTEIGSSA